MPAATEGNSRFAMNYRPHVFWLFGLSGAGKSTLSEALRSELFGTLQARPLMLDGDRLRNGVCRGLGFTDADRAENLRRAAEVARLAVESGQVVLASFITPREQHRRMIEDTVGEEWLSLIHVDADLEVCQERDVKGLYARAAAGEVRRMTGLSSGFDAPTRCALRLPTGTETLEISAARLARFAREKIELHEGSWSYQTVQALAVWRS